MKVEEFIEYHEENPRVYEAFSRFTFEAINAGRTYFSARAIYERMRWFSRVEDTSEQFKLSDHPMPFYARLFENKNPEYRGFFRKHKCEADELGTRTLE